MTQATVSNPDNEGPRSRASGNIRGLATLFALCFLTASSVLGAADAVTGTAAQADRARERVIISLTAREALAAMEKGILSSEEYVRVLLDRISRHPQINAFIQVDPAQSLAAARLADEQRALGQSLGPLHGLPVLLKDNINTADFPTSGGTPALQDHQPDENAPVAQALIDAGAIILGKTNLHELALGITSNNAFFGPVRNPYDTDLIPGGSSGGNGAALAARFAPVAVGSDTGGSVRMPAALTGTMGFRPSSGRYPQAGIVPLSATLDTAGPMGLSVDDLALLDSVITGAPVGLEWTSLRGLRLGIPRGHFRENLAPAVEAALEEVFRRLERSGAVLVDADIPGVPDPSVAANQLTVGFEWPRDLNAYLASNGTGLDFSTLAPTIASQDVALLAQFVLNNPVPESLYEQIVFGVRPALQAGYQDYLADNDLDGVIYPTTPLPAAPIGQDFFVELNGESVPTLETYVRNTHFTPVIGAPTLTLPVGLTDDGLPVGIDLAGPLGGDRRILAIGAAIDRVLPPVPPPSEIQPRPLPPF